MTPIMLALRLLQALQIMSLADALKKEMLGGLLDTDIDVKSSFIDTARYTTSNDQMTLRFKDGRTKTYDVSIDTFLKLVTASSPGGYFNANIRDD